MYPESRHKYSTGNFDEPTVLHMTNAICIFCIIACSVHFVKVMLCILTYVKIAGLT